MLRPLVYGAGPRDTTVSSRRKPIRWSRELRLETLEDRRLLSVDAVSLPNDLEDYGVDLAGRDALFRVVGRELALLSTSYEQSTTFDNLTDFFQRPVLESFELVRDRVAIIATASAGVDQLATDLRRLGIVNDVRGRVSIGGMLPLASLDELARLETVRFVRPAARPLTDVGLVDTQGDVTMRSDEARSRFSVNGFVLNGAGVTIGVLSDSFNASGGAATDIANGDLPGPGNPDPNLQTPVAIINDDFGSDEGRALIQILHDIAPHANFAFATLSFFTPEFAFPLFVDAMINDHGADIIVDDYTFREAPMFQDGHIAQEVDATAAAGVPYFTSAGNTGQDSYQGAFVPNSAGIRLGGHIAHDFDPGPSVDVFQSITIPEGAEASFFFQWDEPFFSVSPGSGGSASDMDILLFDENGVAIAGGLSSNIGGDPIDNFTYFNPTGSGRTQFSVAIRSVSGHAPGVVKYIMRRIGVGDLTIDEHLSENRSTTFGHNNAAGVGSVGAAAFFQTPEFGVDPAVLETFSARGGLSILFDTDGNRLPEPELRNKPDFVAPDNVNTSFFGVDVPEDPDSFPNFRGTSAASPHAAALAALMLQVDPTLSPGELYQVMQDTAVDQGDPGFDFDWGAGLLDAVGAVYKVWTPEFPMLAGAAGFTTGDSQPTFTGIVPAGSYVVLLANGVEVGSQQLPEGETDYSVSPSAPMAAGTYDFSIRLSETAATPVANRSRQSPLVLVTIESSMEPPVAEANGPYAADEGSMIQFDSTGSVDSDGTIVLYEWDFGDGTTATGANPTHAYAGVGEFTVTLTVTDNDGLTATDTAMVTVANVAPTADAGGPYASLVGSSIQFAGSASDPGVSVLTYQWDFDYDGVTFTADASGVDLTAPAHTYSSAGTFTVALIVVDGEGGSSPIVTAQVDVANLQVGPVTFVEVGSVWNYFDAGIDLGAVWRDASFDDSSWLSGAAQLGYGDGDETTEVSFGSDSNDKHITTYFRHAFDVADAARVADLTLRLLRDDGAVVYLNGKEVKRDNMPEGEVNFDTPAEEVVSGSAESVFHEFALDSGDLVSGMNVLAVEIHQFLPTSSDISFDLELSGRITGLPPAAEANGPYAGLEGSAIQFDSTGSSDPDGAIVLYQWDFGDGATATEANPTHVYADNGQFTVTLTVTDNDGLTATDTATVDVSNVAPTADAGGPYAGQIGASVMFAGSGADAGADTLTYEWDFDFDGVTFTADAAGVDLTAPTHTYTSVGTFTVALLVTDDDGDSSPIATASVDVVDLPTGPATLVETGSVWNYFDAGIDLGTAWRDTSFDDGAWQSGAAQLGYGDGDEVTEVSFGSAPGNKHITTYFRHAFVLGDAARVAELTLRLLRDDGAVVYLNGKEAKRDNMPDGEILFDTRADTGVSGSAESTFFEFVLDPDDLSDGMNVVAVEIHQILPNSSDISFDLELVGTIVDLIPPVAEANGPYAGDEGSEIQFDSTGSVDIDGTIVTYHWDFGDGTTAAGANPTHTYADNGQFTVTLTVTDNHGMSAADTATVDVANVAPAADAGGPYAGEVDAEVIFAGSAVDPGADVLTYEWDFDFDGVTFMADVSGVDLIAPMHTYTSAGTFTLALLVTDDDGDSGPVATSSVTIAAPPLTAPFLQTGVLLGVNNTDWTTVTLEHAYTSMVVVVTPNYDAASPPMVPRIRNAVGNSFEVRMDRADGDPSTEAGVNAHFMVVEEGVYNAADHGAKLEAVKFTSTVTDRANSFQGQRQNYQQSYSTPVVVGQVMSYNDPAFSVFWSRGRRAVQPPASSVLFVGKHVAEDANINRADETVGYIVIESGNGVINGQSFLARLGTDTVQGVDNSPPYPYLITGVPSPKTAIASQTAMDGGNGGWAVLYGNSALLTNRLALAIDEDQLADAERAHTSEQVAFLVFGDSDANGPPNPSDPPSAVLVPPRQSPLTLVLEDTERPTLLSTTVGGMSDHSDPPIANGRRADGLSTTIATGRQSTPRAASSDGEPSAAVVDAVLDELYSARGHELAADADGAAGVDDIAVWNIPFLGI